MESNDPKILIRVAAAVYPLCELGDDARRRLADQGRLDLLKSGTRITAAADASWLTFLVRGEVMLISDKGEREVVHANSPRARLPLFRVHPPGLYAEASVASMCVRFPRTLLQALLLAEHGADGAAGEIVMMDPEQDSPLYQRIYQAFQREELELPALPDVALRIREAIRDPAVGIKDVAKMVLADPVLAARLIHAANSAAYRRDKPVTTVYQAVTRLGLSAAQDIAISLALKHLFKSDAPLLQQRMQALYNHSSQIASLAYVLARHSHGFNAERAMLAGLLHDIGVIPILTYAAKHGNLQHDAQELDKTIAGLRRITCHLVLSRLGFEDDLITAAEQAEDWMRNNHAAPDYADLLVVAQLHSHLGTPRMQHLPRIDTTPAYRKLDLGEFDPHNGLAILREANSVSSAIHQLLH
jgi:HD-like signal output (HDOD) protein